MLANRFVRLSVIYALIGMSIGIAMAMSGNHDQTPTHAHINLLGYVSMMLYGLFYQTHPKAAEGKLAVAHFWLSNIAMVGIGVGLALTFGGMPEAEPIAAVSSLVMIASMAVFATIVFRATK